MAKPKGYEDEPKPRIAISFTLEGEDAKRVLRYMEKEHLRINSEAGRKLMFERLEIWEKEKIA